MTKIDQNFAHDMFNFLHKPLRDLDRKEGNEFLLRFLLGPQHVFEDTQDKIKALNTLRDPAAIRSDLLQYLKDHVGFTKELDNITQNLSENDLRKLIQLAVPLWKQKGTEAGYKNILRLFTGKGSRVFNWFDFRWVVGEKALGSEQLGEDAWLISLPGVESSEAGDDVVLLLKMDGDLSDSTKYQNHGQDHARLNFFHGGVHSDGGQFASFDGGLIVPPGRTEPLPGDIVTVPFHQAYDFSGDVTIELFFKTRNDNQQVTLFNMSDGSKEISISIDTSTGQFSYILNDGLSTVTGSQSTVNNMADGVWRHIALIVNKTEKKARLYLDGDESTSLGDLSSLASLTMFDTPIFIGGSDFETDLFAGDLDEVRISLSDKYNVLTNTLIVPGVSFPVHQEEQLDEFKTDIRVVDQGELNRTLIKRILNLMRPVSERLNVIYVRFFEDFSAGKGNMSSLSVGASVANSRLKLPAGAVEVDNSDGADDYQDMVLQVRQRFNTSGEFIIRCLHQDNDNHYRFRVKLDTEQAYFEKVVGGAVAVLAGPVSIPVAVDTFYIWTVVTDFNPNVGESVIKCYQDNNLVMEVYDSTYNQGTWGVESLSGESALSEVEMFLIPLDVETVNPGFSL